MAVLGSTHCLTSWVTLQHVITTIQHMIAHISNISSGKTQAHVVDMHDLSRREACLYNQLLYKGVVFVLFFQPVECCRSMAVLVRSLRLCLTSEGQQAVLAAIICLLVLQTFLDSTAALQVSQTSTPRQQVALLLKCT